MCSTDKYMPDEKAKIIFELNGSIFAPKTPIFYSLGGEIRDSQQDEKGKHETARDQYNCFHILLKNLPCLRKR